MAKRQQFLNNNVQISFAPNEPAFFCCRSSICDTHSTCSNADSVCNKHVTNMLKTEMSREKVTDFFLRDTFRKSFG